MTFTPNLSISYSSCCISVLLALILQVKAVGASSAQPVLVVISFDGFKPDYLQMDGLELKNLKNVSEGVLAQRGMIPCFVTKTFPNHFSIATGLYEETHGIIDNIMYDAKMKPPHFEFNSNMSNWWDNGLNMPLWILNQQKEGHFSGVSMWPGCDSSYQGHTPEYILRFNNTIPWEYRVDVAMSWITNKDKPANCIFIYFNQPDHSAHRTGPFSNETLSQVQRIDRIVGYFLSKVEQFKLKDRLNLIIVSDHGMAEVEKSHQMELFDILPSKSSYNYYGSGPFMGIRPVEGKFDEIYNTLQNATKYYNMTVKKKEDVPDMFHYKNNRRVQPILMFADLGYQFITWNDTQPGNMRGSHGYNNRLIEMRALFMAKGPSFKTNVVVPPFENVNLYSLMSHILGLKPYTNNGTLDDVMKSMLADNGTVTAPTSNSQQFIRSFRIVCISLLVICSLMGIIAVILVVRKPKRDTYHQLMEYSEE